MKSKLLLISLLIVQFVNSQNIVFADPDLKATLVNLPQFYSFATNITGNQVPIDTNNDNEISIAEALQINSLFIINENISNLQGLEYFVNI